MYLSSVLEATLRSPFFGIILTLGAYLLGKAVDRRVKSPLANVMVIAFSLIIALLVAFDIPYQDYNVGGTLISLMLVPVTALLGITVYHKRAFLRANLIPIFVGCFVGSMTSVAGTWLLCHLCGIDVRLTLSLLPKTVTTPIALELSEAMGGIAPLTTAVVAITGIIGTIIAPSLFRLFRIDDPLARGVALGSSSHAIGTSKALELGETEGAASGVSLVITGFILIIVFPFIASLLAR